MKILSWNCCGLGKRCAVNELEELISSLLPNIIFFMEVKVDQDAV